MSRETDIKSKMILPVWTVRSELHTKANTLWQHGLKFKNKTPQPTTKFSFSQDHVILLTRTFRIRWKRKKNRIARSLQKAEEARRWNISEGYPKLYCAARSWDNIFIICICTSFHFPNSGLYLLNGFDFYFDLFWMAWHWKPATGKLDIKRKEISRSFQFQRAFLIQTCANEILP